MYIALYYHIQVLIVNIKGMILSQLKSPILLLFVSFLFVIMMVQRSKGGRAVHTFGKGDELESSRQSTCLWHRRYSSSSHTLFRTARHSRRRFGFGPTATPLASQAVS